MMTRMRNLKLTVAYDGTNFAGWQVQPDKLTVQEVIEQAIFDVTGDRLRVLSAGRTDAGVHAVGQVVNFRTRTNIPPDRLRLALQAKLGPEVTIRDIKEVPLEFHATFSAVRKRYCYLIHNAYLSSPFLRRYSHWIRNDLDLVAMNQAAAHLVGKHDFRSFETQWPNKATSVRTVLDCQLFRTSEWNWSSLPAAGSLPPDQAPFVVLSIQADGFLYNMVRTIMGTLLKVGIGKWTDKDVKRILESQDRNVAGPTAPAHGLYLFQVDYDGADDLANAHVLREGFTITRNHRVLLEQASPSDVDEGIDLEGSTGNNG